MNREYSEDTLKSNLIIPVPYKKLVFAKIAVTGFAVILFIIASFLCSIVFAVILGYPLEMKEVGMAFGKLFCHRRISCPDSGDAYYCTLYLEKKSFSGWNLWGVCLWVLWYFCSRYTFYKLVSNHIWLNHHKL